MSNGLSPELVVALVTAGVSAAASILVAVIQAGRKRDGETASPADAPPPARERGLTSMIRRIDFGEAPRGGSGVDAVWLVVVLVVIVAMIALGTREPESAAALNALIVIPAVTLVLALARPIGWGYAAGAVTLLHAATFIAAKILTRGEWESDPEVFLLAFVANALIVGGVAFLRTRARPAALGGTLVVCGVGAVTWLFVPMLLQHHGHGPEPGPHAEEHRDPREPIEMMPIRVHPGGKLHPSARERIDPRDPDREHEVEAVKPAATFSRRFKLDFRRIEPRPE